MFAEKSARGDRPWSCNHGMNATSVPDEVSGVHNRLKHYDPEKPSKGISAAQSAGKKRRPQEGVQSYDVAAGKKLAGHTVEFAMCSQHRRWVRLKRSPADCAAEMPLDGFSAGHGVCTPLNGTFWEKISCTLIQWSRFFSFVFFSLHSAPLPLSLSLSFSLLGTGPQ